jgi:hypothetical protein
MRHLFDFWPLGLVPLLVVVVALARFGTTASLSNAFQKILGAILISIIMWLAQIHTVCTRPAWTIATTADKAMMSSYARNSIGAQTTV